MKAVKRIKIGITAAAVVFGLTACFGGGDDYSIAASKTYEASLFRQHCAICHGPEGDGRTLDDGTIVPSLRHGDFKKRTPGEIRRQIVEGGNGMAPFGSQLSEREVQMMVDLVHDKLRKNSL